jgi:hypothetical protein
MVSPFVLFVQPVNIIRDFKPFNTKLRMRLESRNAIYTLLSFLAAVLNILANYTLSTVRVPDRILGVEFLFTNWQGGATAAEFRWWSPTQLLTGRRVA